MTSGGVSDKGRGKSSPLRVEDVEPFFGRKPKGFWLEAQVPLASSPLKNTPQLEDLVE